MFFGTTSEIASKLLFWNGLPLWIGEETSFENGNPFQYQIKNKKERKKKDSK